MNTQRWRSLVVLCMMVGALVIAGCENKDEDFRDATAADLQNKVFTFDAGIIDPAFTGLAMTVTFGSFTGNTGVFSLTLADGSTIGGTVAIGNSCTFTSTFEALADEEPAAIVPPDVSTANPCEVNKKDGSLRLTFDGEESLSDPPTDVATVLDLNVALSPANVVEPQAPLGNRPETGTAVLRLLSGNLLRYSITVNNLTAGETLTNAHIHRGDATENGGIFLTLVGNPPQPPQGGRTANIQFGGTNTVNATIVLSAAEVAELTDVATPLYVQVHSSQVSRGLLRGQIEADIVAAYNIPLSPANAVPPITGRQETGAATLRLLAGNVLVYTLTVNNLSAEDALTNAHIHRGRSTETGGIFVTLVGAPTQPSRPTNPQFNGATTVTNEFLLTAAEVAELTNPDNSFYVNVHSQQVSAGLLRGQLRDTSSPVNRAPTANAGADQTVTVGATVQLNGGGSSDPDGDTLTYAWSFSSRPAGSNAALSNAAIVNPTFVADVAGNYVVQLIVNDGTVNSAPDTVAVTATAAAVGNPITGGTLFAAGGCNACHGAGGTGGIGPNLLDRTAAQIQNAPASVGAHSTARGWNNQQAADVSAFLKTVSFATDVQPIFTPNCAFSGCHAGTSPPRGLNLEAGQAYANLVNVPSSGVPTMDRVEPGNLNASYLYLKHTGAPGIVGSRMPLGDPTFFDRNPTLLDLERRWILQGARNN